MQSEATLKAGFAEMDITPPLGTQLAGWLDVARPAERIRDPVFARMAVIESHGERVGFISLDLLSIRGSDVMDIRQRIEAAANIPAKSIMIAATHNHAGPAIVTIGPYRREETYLEGLKVNLTRQAVEAVNRLEPAEIGIGTGFEGRLAFNRRWITKSGLTRCQPGTANPDVLCPEGPVDTQLGVICLRRPGGRKLGYLVNWTCHTVQVYDMRTVTAAWPGALAREVKEREGCPCLLLNGAFGNIMHHNSADQDFKSDPDRMGAVLAGDLSGVVNKMQFRTEAKLAVTQKLLQLPLREISAAEIEESKRILAGEEVKLRPGVQRYGRNTTYAASILQLVERKKERNFSRAEVQAIRVGHTVFVGLPAEAFVEIGLKIKFASPFDPTFVVGAANGMVGYAPPPESHARGGYECTTAHWSKVAPEAATMMGDMGIELARQLFGAQ